MTLSNEQYYRILKQVSIKLNGNESFVWIKPILSEIGLEEYKPYSQEITKYLEDKFFVKTNTSHSFSKFITRLLPAAIDYLREFELNKESDKPKPSNRKWLKKTLDFLDKVILLKK